MTTTAAVPTVPIVPEKDETEEKRIRAARIFLINKQPFFGHLAMGLEILEVPGLGTMATDSKHLMYDPEFTKKVTNKQLLFCVGHEVMHAALRHPKRGQGKFDSELFNISADILINEMLQRNGVGDMPGFCMTKDKVKYKDKTPLTKDVLEYSADDLYFMIDSEKSGLKGVPKWSPDGGNKPGPCGGIKAPADELTDDVWKARVQAAVKRAGTAPAGMEAYIEELTNTKKNWKEILADYVVPCMGDYTLVPPDRRFLGWGQPGLLDDVFDAPLIIETIDNDEELEDIVYAVDTSGSMSDPELQEAISEAVEIGKIANRSWLIYCDAAVHGVHELTDEFPPRPVGRGGTYFHPVFQEVQKRIDEGKMKVPKVLVYFTDGYGDFSFTPPEYDVLWIINNKTVKAPWGMSLEYP